MENGMELFNNYLEEIKGTVSYSDLGSLIALALLGSGKNFDHLQAIGAIKRAMDRISEDPIAPIAQVVLSGVIHRLAAAEELSALE